jgi:glycosyltransferase involved in cell wall biosynthesis
MRILIVASFIPWPPDSGARIRTWEIARRFQREHQVVFGLHVRCQEDLTRLDAIRGQGFEVIAGRVNSGLRALSVAVHEILAGGPPLFALRRSHELETKLASAHAAVPFDVIQIEHFELARYAELIDRRGGNRRRTVFSLVLHDLLSVAYARMADVEPDFWWRVWRRYNAMRLAIHERKLLPRYDLCITVSSNDQAEISRYLDPAKVYLLPNCVDSATKTFLEERSGGPPALLFVGLLMYPPNADAARWLASEIFPRVRAIYPECRLYIVGDAAPPDLINLNGQGVELTGRVDSLGPWYAKCDVALAPVRAGGGTRLKILEAMAYGRPVVSTTLGAEGLSLRHGEHLLLADTTEDFALAIVEVIQNRALRIRLRKAARKLVEECYSWDKYVHRQLNLYSALTQRVV